MSDQKRPISGDEAITRAKDYAKDNPDSARSAIDKVEDFLDSKTGGTFSGMIDKGGDMVEKGLGIPSNEGGTLPSDPSVPPADPGSTPTTPTEPTSPSQPEQPSEVPVPNPSPGTGDPQPQQDPTAAPSTIPGEGAEQMPEPAFPPPDAQSPTQGSPSPGEAGGLPQGGTTQQGDPGATSAPGGSQPADGGNQIDLGQDDVSGGGGAPPPR